MAFSGAVRITDLSDFIAPAQACVVTLSGGKTAKVQVRTFCHAACTNAQIHAAHGSRRLRRSSCSHVQRSQHCQVSPQAL
jgi:hypothetical protein